MFGKFSVIQLVEVSVGGLESKSDTLPINLTIESLVDVGSFNSYGNSIRVYTVVNNSMKGTFDIISVENVEVDTMGSHSITPSVNIETIAEVIVGLIESNSELLLPDYSIDMVIGVDDIKSLMVAGFDVSIDQEIKSELIKSINNMQNIRVFDDSTFRIRSKENVESDIQTKVSMKSNVQRLWKMRGGS